MPIVFGLAQPVILSLYGAKWQAAATPLAMLTLASAITVAIGMTSELFILRHATPRQVRIEGARSVVGFLMFAGGAMISLPVAAAAKVAEAVFAFLLYRRPMVEMVGGAPNELGRLYREGLLLGAAAILPSLLLMVWTRWSPLTPLPLVIVCVAIGVLGWGLLLLQRQHPIALELTRLLSRRR